ncbi:alpha-L-rhamnosidase C-terminal domain-containing protein [Streptomyces sp. NPDC021098]|uniref:alpha-L-rhamnosidase C-terminal domain-containing protein n=1 Tax=unclassified Streptomyces TaxID=2593676 RepID=UPI003792B523
MARHARPGRHHDLGGLERRRRERRRPRLAQPLQQGRRHPLPAHPHPRTAAGRGAWESFVVAPVPHPTVDWAHGTFDGPRGTIAVEWRTETGELHLTVDIPPTSTATVVFPDGEEVPAGPGRFTARRYVGTQ